MKQFPHAIEIGNIHIGTIAGKLNGVIPAQIQAAVLLTGIIPVPTFSETDLLKDEVFHMQTLLLQVL